MGQIHLEEHLGNANLQTRKIDMKNVKYHTLIKQIHFVKFICSDDESRYFAASPYTGEVLRELVQKFDTSYQGEESFFEVNEGTPWFNLVRRGVLKNLERTVEWKNMSNESKAIHLENLLSPYFMGKSHLQKLIEDSNKFHNI